MYFDSLDDQEKNKAGTLAAQSEVGDYFAGLSRHAGKGYAECPPVTVDGTYRRLSSKYTRTRSKPQFTTERISP
jgi:hypothetical protein